MRILNILQCGGFGGIEKSCIELCIAMKNQNIDVAILVLGGDDSLRVLAEKNQIRYRHLKLKSQYDIRIIYRLYKNIFETKPTHIIQFGHFFLCQLSLLLMNNKKLLYIHSIHKDDRSLIKFKILYLLSFFTFKNILFCSEYIKKEAVSICPIISNKSDVLHNIVNIKNITKNENDTIFIGGAGHLIKEKRFDIFFLIAKNIIQQKKYECRFIIAGDGPYRAELEKQIQKNNLKNYFEFLGWKEEMEDFYKKIDIFLFHSDGDAMGRVMLEAAAHGIPVIGSVTKGGVKEVLGKSGAGTIIDSHDISTLTDKIVELMDDKNLRKVTGIRCREAVKIINNPTIILNKIKSYLN